MKKLSRRDFLKLSGKGLGIVGLGSVIPFVQTGCETEEFDRGFTFAVIADTHIIDEFYDGIEKNAYDTYTIFKAEERFIRARDEINRTNADSVFICGDYVHDYPSQDRDFYFENKTRFDIAHEISLGFNMPVYPGFGNHDYGVPLISREFSHDLFREKFKVQPYYAVNRHGYNFIHLNNFLGDTWDPLSDSYNPDEGSFGEEQLLWLESRLAEESPAFIFTHYSLFQLRKNEYRDMDLFSIVHRHREKVMMVITGHLHLWFDTAKLFGFRTIGCASTRFDAGNYMIIDVDRNRNRCRVANKDRFIWATPWSMTTGFDERN